MIIRKFIIFLFLLFETSSSVAFEDTMVLLQMLGQEIQATQGILQMLKVSSETLDKVEKAHFTVHDVSRQAMQVKYFIDSTRTLPERMKKIKNMRTLRDNLFEIRNSYRDGKSVTDGFSEMLNNFGFEENIKELKKLNEIKTLNQRELAYEYYIALSSAREGGQAKILGSRATALNSTILLDIKNDASRREDLEMMKDAIRDIEQIQEKKREFNKRKMLGMIPDICFEDYLADDWNIPKINEFRKNKRKIICKNKTYQKVSKKG